MRSGRRTSSRRSFQPLGPRANEPAPGRWHGLPRSSNRLGKQPNDQGIKAYAERTIAAYRVHARKAARNWAHIQVPSRFLKRFAAALPPGGRVLDYGCGIGVELAWLRRQGFQAEGIDGALEFVFSARRRCPGAQVLHARFESVPLPAGLCDGIWCNAALIHVPPEELSRQLEKLAKTLKPGGLLGLTLAWGRAKRFTRRDWIPGRYFAAYTRQEVKAVLQCWDAREIKVTASSGRRGRWIQILCHNRNRYQVPSR